MYRCFRGTTSSFEFQTLTSTPIKIDMQTIMIASMLKFASARDRKWSASGPLTKSHAPTDIPMMNVAAKRSTIRCLMDRPSRERHLHVPHWHPFTAWNFSAMPPRIQCARTRLWVAKGLAAEGAPGLTSETWVLRTFDYFLSVSASTPGSFFPSRNSRLAPPPVEMCVTWSA
jgi:hypothetical protein